MINYNQTPRGYHELTWLPLLHTSAFDSDPFQTSHRVDSTGTTLSGKPAARLYSSFVPRASMQDPLHAPSHIMPKQKVIVQTTKHLWGKGPAIQEKESAREWSRTV